MTVRLSPAVVLDKIIRQARHLLFAFDVPIRSGATGKPPAPYVHDVLTACRESGRSAAIVTTTPIAEIHAYLDAHDLSSRVEIVATSFGQAVSALNASPADCAVIASGSSEIEAAQAAGVSAIAYTKTSDDIDRQAVTRVTAVVYSLSDIALKLRARLGPL